MNMNAKGRIEGLDYFFVFVGVILATIIVYLSAIEETKISNYNSCMESCLNVFQFGKQDFNYCNSDCHKVGFNES